MTTSGTQTANILFNIADTGDKTYGTINSALPMRSYCIMGRSSRDTLTNKTLIDESNNIAANSLRNGSLTTAMSDNSTPSIGDVLTVLGDSTLGWETPSGGSLPLPSSTHIVYVDKSGNDTTGDGSIGAPYLTINKAYTIITSASTTNRYSISVGPGRFDETGDIILKPWVWLIGTQRTATRVTSSTNIVRLDSSFTNGNYRFGAVNILFSGSTNVNFDLQALGGSGSTVFESDALYVNNTFTFKGRTSADFIELWSSQFLGTMNLYSLQGLIRNCYCGNNIIITDSGGSENCYVDINNTYIEGNVTITQTLSNTFICKLLGSYINGGTLSLTSTGTLAVTTDGISLPITVNTSGTVSLTRAAKATALGYIPGDATSWASSAPSTIQSALDRLAAQVKVLSSGTPIP